MKINKKVCDLIDQSECVSLSYAQLCDKMATPSKKLKTEHGASKTDGLDGNTVSKGLDAKLSAFMSWCEAKKFNVDKKVRA